MRGVIECRRYDNRTTAIPHEATYLPCSADTPPPTDLALSLLPVARWHEPYLQRLPAQRIPQPRALQNPRNLSTQSHAVPQLDVASDNGRIDVHRPTADY